MGKKVIFFLAKEQNLAKILFYLSIASILGFVVVSTTHISLVQVGWGYGTSPLSAPPVLPNSSSVSNSGAIVINSDAEETGSRDVTLTLNAKGAARMALSNEIDFNSSNFEPFTTTKSWTLSEGNGQKSVFVRFQSAAGGMSESSDTIVLTGQNSNAPQPSSNQEQGNKQQSQPRAGLQCVAGQDEVFKASNSSAVYITTDGCVTKHAFRSPAVFFSYFDSYSRIVVLAPAEVNAIPNNAVAFAPWGPRRTYVNGDILKTPLDSKVYIVVNGKKNWISSESVFSALYGSWSVVEDVDQRVLDSFGVGQEITSTEIHPDGTLVKSADDPKVYLIENGRLRWIVNEDVFDRLQYRRDRIFVITNADAYDLGPDIVS